MCASALRVFVEQVTVTAACWKVSLSSCKTRVFKQASSKTCRAGCFIRYTILAPRPAGDVRKDRGNECGQQEAFEPTYSSDRCQIWTCFENCVHRRAVSILADVGYGGQFFKESVLFGFRVNGKATPLAIDFQVGE